MNFTTKVFAIVTGAAFTTFAVNKLVRPMNLFFQMSGQITLNVGYEDVLVHV